MRTITLKSLAFSACYGLYPEEQQRPNRFEVDLSVSIPAAQPDAPPFVDYQVLHDAAQLAFDHLPASQTLEALLAQIYAQLRGKIPAGAHVSLAIRKLQPALGAPLAWAGVTFEEDL